MSHDASMILALAPPAAAPDSLVASVLDMVMKGGWTMIPLGLCSLVAVTIVVERLIVMRRSRVAPPALRAEVLASRADPHAALARCKADRSPLGAVLGALARAAHEPRAVQEARAAEAGQREVLKLRHRMRLLSCLPQTATMLGLLGTVFGMIRTFTAIAASGEALGKTERLAQGIYEAWTATAAGLVVAIPTLVAYHLLMARIDAAAAALDSAAAEWLEHADERPAPRHAPEPAPASLNGRGAVPAAQGVAP